MSSAVPCPRAEAAAVYVLDDCAIGDSGYLSIEGCLGVTLKRSSIAHAHRRRKTTGKLLSGKREREREREKMRRLILHLRPRWRQLSLSLAVAVLASLL